MKDRCGLVCGTEPGGFQESPERGLELESLVGSTMRFRRDCGCVLGDLAILACCHAVGGADPITMRVFWVLDGLFMFLFFCAFPGSVHLFIPHSFVLLVVKYFTTPLHSVDDKL